MLALAAVLLASVSLPASALFDPPPSYYDTAIGKTGSTVKAALHAVIKGHKVLPQFFLRMRFTKPQAFGDDGRSRVFETGLSFVLISLGS